MAKHDAKAGGGAKGAHELDTVLSPELFVPWTEITSDEVEAFESTLNGARNEADMQRFIEENPHILIQEIAGGRGAWVIPQKRLGSEHVTDFLVAQESSSGFAWWAVELKGPQALVFTKNGDPSAILNHALRQIGDWRDWLSNNRDYAARSRTQSGLGLTDIDPELEGLIIIGRDAGIDPATIGRRRRLARERRVKIETYDWLLYQARERAKDHEGRIRSGTRNLIAAAFDAFSASPRQSRSVENLVTEVFGGTFGMSTRISAIRDIDWEGIDLAPDYPDVVAPVNIVYADGADADRIMPLGDWEDWIDDVVRRLNYNHSLLITENTPSRPAERAPTVEQEGVWFRSHGMYVRCVDVLVHLPKYISYEQKRNRVAVARQLLIRSMPDPILERERERAAEAMISALSLTPGNAVIHDRFGPGAILSIIGSGANTDALIDFGEQFGIKRLALRYAKIKKQ